MPLRWGPGPVFVHESIAATRRWQHYALRSLFVLGLLAALATGWLLMSVEEGTPINSVRINDLAQLGEYFYYAIATTQLLLVLAVAPAATAGAIYLDRARGNLIHMLVTDLGDAEIVLGKLAARLVPVLALVTATVPVLALAGLLGGIIIDAILALTLITLVVALLGCTLALAFSVRATKTHEVLMAVYGIEVVWVLGPVVWELLASSGVLPRIPGWFAGINPFVLAWAPYAWPNYLSVEWLAGVLGGMTATSAALTFYAVFRLRGELTGRSKPRVARWSSWLERSVARLSSWRPGPSLDKDPVLWREWRRSRPSRLARVVWGVFIALSIAGTAGGIAKLVDNYRAGSQFLLFVNGIQATLGLLLVSLAAPTVLAEERVRGGLDVLMTTPLSTDRIVMAKWWGAFRVVPALALLPAIGTVFVASLAPDVVPGVRRFGQPPAPLDVVDRIAYVCLPMALLLAQGAAVTSIGLALATWSRRVGRAVALSVSCYAFLALIGPILIEMIPAILVELGAFEATDQATLESIAEVVGTACPLGSQLITVQTIFWPASQGRLALYIAQIIVLLATVAFALIVLALTIATFDRCMGRVSERRRRAPRPPRRVGGHRGPHIRTGDSRPTGVAKPALGAGV
jgi:ABC-type transport system involved in multi-copper enzyme maturation permease subunit